MAVPRRILPAQTPSALLVVLVLAGCGGGAPGSGDSRPGAPPRATEEEWRALATPRPAPLEGAPRVGLSQAKVPGTPDWSTAGVDAELGLTELMAAGLLRRQDVDFVERRRFAAAAEAERRGTPRPDGAPPAGVSRGLEYLAEATWTRLPMGSRLDVRLFDAETREIVATWKATTPGDADPVSLARLAVGGTLAALDSLDARPEWADPAGAPDVAYRPAGVPARAAEAFFRGLAAEERWRWEEARVGYQAALADGGASFVEATAALARAARLRNGGTLGVG